MSVSQVRWYTVVPSSAAFELTSIQFDWDVLVVVVTRAELRALKSSLSSR